ncbi:MAG: hypothetical protein GY811_07125 [Myxococcales bacterium]|nr:hypothetical protein [Myxococcales bacterium]
MTALACTFWAGKAKGEPPSPPTQDPAPTEAAPAAPAPATQTAPSQPTSASEAERKLASDFIVRFLATIEKGDGAAWPLMHTRAFRDQMLANDSVDRSFAAWHKGTVTVIPHIKAAEFALLRHGDALRYVHPAVCGRQSPNRPRGGVRHHYGHLRMEKCGFARNGGEDLLNSALSSIQTTLSGLLALTPRRLWG